MLKKLWDDPVWSKVIAGVIAGTVLAAGAALYRWGRTWFTYGSRWARRWKLRAELSTFLDQTFLHVPWVSVRVRNPGHKPVIVSSVEFVTKEHWDMLDPLREGVTVPVENHLPPGTALVKISTDKGSLASKAIGESLEPRGSLTVSFRLVTDHAPAYGMGLFPFHLGVSLVYGKGERLPLPDLIVSLHGSITLSSITFAQPWLPVKRGDLQSFANAALSRIAEGAICPPEIVNELKAAARV